MSDDRSPLDEWSSDPDLRRLRGWHRDELRAEAEEYERLAAKDRLRGRGLGDVAVELVHRGDRVTVSFVDRSFAGVVTYAAGDLACLETRSGAVDVNLAAPLVIRLEEPARAGGLRPSPGPQTFTARLFEHEAAGGEVEIGVRGGDGRVTGRIEAVGRDHVVVDAAGQTCYVARAAIDYVVGRP